MSVARDAGPAAETPPVGELVDHLFRRESGRIVSVLTRVFGLRNLELAEDVVQETLWEALRQWPFAGVPRNPAGWLYQVARNKTLDVLRREQAFRRLAPELAEPAAPGGPDQLIEALPSPGAVEDETLRMMFACCHPALTLESQIALTLKVLGGFGVGEIARALLSQESAVQKRLGRARQRIREAAVPFEVPSGEALGPRVGAVLSVLYLMFNEGYSARLVAERVPGHHPAASALLALMCFHAARFAARLDGDGNLLMLCDQDRARWDRDLIAEGFRHLERSAEGEQASPLHLEAGIAALHCLARDYARLARREALSRAEAGRLSRPGGLRLRRAAARSRPRCCCRWWPPTAPSGPR